MYKLLLTVNIRKYGSTFYVGIGQIKNGHLYLRYGSSFEKLQQSEPKHLQTKDICYNIVKNAPRVLLPH